VSCHGACGFASKVKAMSKLFSRTLVGLCLGLMMSMGCGVLDVSPDEGVAPRPPQAPTVTGKIEIFGAEGGTSGARNIKIIIENTGDEEVRFVDLGRSSASWTGDVLDVRGPEGDAKYVGVEPKEGLTIAPGHFVEWHL
jgi:hypothetical protein